MIFSKLRSTFKYSNWLMFCVPRLTSTCQVQMHVAIPVMSDNQIQRNYQCVRIMSIINYPNWQSPTNETTINWADTSRKHMFQHTRNENVFIISCIIDVSHNLHEYSISLKYRYADWNLKSNVTADAHRDENRVKHLITFYLCTYYNILFTYNEIKNK